MLANKFRKIMKRMTTRRVIVPREEQQKNKNIELLQKKRSAQRFNTQEILFTGNCRESQQRFIENLTSEYSKRENGFRQQIQREALKSLVKLTKTFSTSTMSSEEKLSDEFSDLVRSLEDFLANGCCVGREELEICIALWEQEKIQTRRVETFAFEDFLSEIDEYWLNRFNEIISEQYCPTYEDLRSLQRNENPCIGEQGTFNGILELEIQIVNDSYKFCCFPDTERLSGKGKCIPAMQDEFLTCIYVVSLSTLGKNASHKHHDDLSKSFKTFKKLLTNRALHNLPCIVILTNIQEFCDQLKTQNLEDTTRWRDFHTDENWNFHEKFENSMEKIVSEFSLNNARGGEIEVCVCDSALDEECLEFTERKIGSLKTMLVMEVGGLLS